ncbi:hypothetical protein HUG10_15355 [Halorarum halophilum]|uniref:Uncharacterized protein n=1 Tax=Halorarum halophilum TaxID=2743090 RepID=A0A7D5H1Z0_9EURY|nr:hypothetical protein [Halobaculum halophilum]QLG28833.1 hypothetical protein HUG10_15355 [Halobaculum halophilum]
MSSVERASGREDRSWGASTVLGTLRNSATLSLATLGLVLVVIGLLINTGVWAAIFVIWGTALVLFGVTTYSLIQWRRR